MGSGQPEFDQGVSATVLEGGPLSGRMLRGDLAGKPFPQDPNPYRVPDPRWPIGEYRDTGEVIVQDGRRVRRYVFTPLDAQRES